MPSRWLIRLAGLDTDRVQPRHVHAVVSTLLESHLTDGDHHDRVKPYTVRPLQANSDGTAGLEVVVLPDHPADDLLAGRPTSSAEVTSAGEWLVGRLLTSLTALRRQGLHFADQRAEILVDDGDALPARLVDHRPWGELAATPPASHVTFRVAPPGLTFRNGNRSQPLPVPGSVFGHLRSRWTAFARHPIRFDLEQSPVTVTDFDLRSHAVAVRDRPVATMVGTVAYQLHDCRHGARQAFARLAAAAPFVGIGSFVTHGLGAVEVSLAAVEP